MKFSGLENVLWGAGFIGDLSLLAVLLVKKRWPDFPVFTSFAVYAAVETIVLFLVSRYADHRAYSHAYWTLACLDYVFQIAIIFEMGQKVLRPAGTWLKGARRSFLSWSLAGAAIAAALAHAVTPPGKTGLSLWSVRSMVFTSLLTCETFLGMAVAANRLHLQWRSHVMALGQGLTAWAIIGLTTDIVRYAVGWPVGLRIFDVINSSAYLGALLYWTISFSLPEGESAPLPSDTREYVLSLHEKITHGLDILGSVKGSSR